MRQETLKVNMGKGEQKKTYETKAWVWESEDVVDNKDGTCNVHLPEGVTFDLIRTFVNYGHNLKQRAKVTAEHTEKGAKEKNRIEAQTNVMKVKFLMNDSSYFDAWQEELKKSVKDANAYLDELATTDEWKELVATLG